MAHAIAFAQRTHQSAICDGYEVRYAPCSTGQRLASRCRGVAAGSPSTKNISSLQFAPTFNINLPNHWFFTFYPSEDIRVNYGDPVTGQTGRLFLPVDFILGRKLTQNLVLSLEVSVPIIKDYPVYDFKTEVRLNLLF